MVIKVRLALNQLQDWAGFVIEAHQVYMPVNQHNQVIMKKTFKLTHEKLNTDRHIDAVRHEIRKYIKRERNRKLPVDADFWDFDCRFGANEASSESIHLSVIDKSINGAIAEQLESFYLEILAKPGNKVKKEAE